MTTQPQLKTKDHITPTPEYHESSWGWHAISYPTFLKLKALHKRVWEAWYQHNKLMRWSRKTVHRSPEQPATDPYFTIFTEARDYYYSNFLQYRKHFPGEYHEQWICATFYLPEEVETPEPKVHFHGDGCKIVETMRMVRTPASSREEVEKPPLPEEEIDKLYKELFGNIDPEIKHQTQT